nr:hypothetical protein [Paenibacillus sp. cl141a]
MMKVLIADDDVYTREGHVEAIEWKRLGIQEFLQAEDGSQRSSWQRPIDQILSLPMFGCPS